MGEENVPARDPVSGISVEEAKAKGAYIWKDGPKVAYQDIWTGEGRSYNLPGGAVLASGNVRCSFCDEPRTVAKMRHAENYACVRCNTVYEGLKEKDLQDERKMQQAREKCVAESFGSRDEAMGRVNALDKLLRAGCAIPFTSEKARIDPDTNEPADA